MLIFSFVKKLFKHAKIFIQKLNFKTNWKLYRDENMSLYFYEDLKQNALYLRGLKT